MSSPKKKIKKRVLRPVQKMPTAKKDDPEVEYEVSDIDLASAAERLGEVKSLLDDLGEEDQRLRSTVKTGMQERDMKKLAAPGASISLKNRMSTIIDEETLKKRLGSKMWNKVTVRSLSMQKVRAFIASGEIDTAVLAACSSEEPGSDYIEVRKR